MTSPTSIPTGHRFGTTESFTRMLRAATEGVDDGHTYAMINSYTVGMVKAIVDGNYTTTAGIDVRQQILNALAAADIVKAERG